jgi:hypothetical protein
MLIYTIHFKQNILHIRTIAKAFVYVENSVRINIVCTVGPSGRFCLTATMQNCSDEIKYTHYCSERVQCIYYGKMLVLSVDTDIHLKLCYMSYSAYPFPFCVYYIGTQTLLNSDQHYVMVTIVIFTAYLVLLQEDQRESIALFICYLCHVI